MNCFWQHLPEPQTKLIGEGGNELEETSELEHPISKLKKSVESGLIDSLNAVPEEKTTLRREAKKLKRIQNGAKKRLGSTKVPNRNIVTVQCIKHNGQSQAADEGQDYHK